MREFDYTSLEAFQRGREATIDTEFPAEAVDRLRQSFANRKVARPKRETGCIVANLIRTQAARQQQRNEAARTILLDDDGIRAVHERYIAGEATAVLAEIAGVAWSTVVRHFHRLGLPLRGGRDASEFE